ncbi:MAG: beta-ketoacyl-ACP synthase II [Solirubrobacteraceae bacterium MAG38_C4-C5]|nr:beta-ketoacyl-ACP synthase II [Candidatus Siliceabacter maunaloa]
MSRRRVVITGVGAVTPLGVGADGSLKRWVAGESGIEDGLGRCDEFAATDFLSKKEARRADRFTQLSIAAAQEALTQAGFEDGPTIDPERVGCIIATGVGGIATVEAGQDVLREKGAGRVSPALVPMMMPNASAGTLALRYGLRGPSHSVASACAAGADAIGAAARLIRTGEADAVVTGGAEAGLTPLARAAFDNMGALSPSGISRPFDARRDGFVMGEGAGVLVLEDAQTAAKRGQAELGEVIGFGATSDAHHITAPQPEGSGAARAIERALEDAGIGPDDLDYVNAHGTSTPLNDRAETMAIVKALGEAAKRVPVSSTKSVTGHVLGAAGAIEAILTLLALREGVTPPTVGWEEREEGMDLDYVPRARPLRAKKADGAVAISNAFGFGGHNAVVCLRAS